MPQGSTFVTVRYHHAVADGACNISQVWNTWTILQVLQLPATDGSNVTRSYVALSAINTTSAPDGQLVVLGECWNFLIAYRN